MTFSNAFSWKKFVVFWCKFHWIMFLRVLFLNKSALVQVLETSHYMNQWWPSDVSETYMHPPVSWIRPSSAGIIRTPWNMDSMLASKLKNNVKCKYACFLKIWHGKSCKKMQGKTKKKVSIIKTSLSSCKNVTVYQLGKLNKQCKLQCLSVSA